MHPTNQPSSFFLRELYIIRMEGLNHPNEFVIIVFDSRPSGTQWSNRTNETNNNKNPVSMATEQKADVPQCLQLSDIREHLIRLEETVRARVSTCCVACLFHDHLIAC